MTGKPETDEELAALPGTVTPHNAAIRLEPYDPAWPARALAEPSS